MKIKQNYMVCGLATLVMAAAALLVTAGPAVRVADGSAHGGIVTDPGPATNVFRNVFINGLPSVTVGAFHTCPLVSGIIPHVGGPIFSGSAKVFVGGVPVAVTGSAAICVGPTDVIIGGSTNVFVNH